jgi:hypothetical protein
VIFAYISVANVHKKAFSKLGKILEKAAEFNKREFLVELGNFSFGAA